MGILWNTVKTLHEQDVCIFTREQEVRYEACKYQKKGHECVMLCNAFPCFFIYP